MAKIRAQGEKKDGASQGGGQAALHKGGHQRDTLCLWGFIPWGDLGSGDHFGPPSCLWAVIPLLGGIEDGWDQPLFVCVPRPWVLRSGGRGMDGDRGTGWWQGGDGRGTVALGDSSCREKGANYPRGWGTRPPNPASLGAALPLPKLFNGIVAQPSFSSSSSSRAQHPPPSPSPSPAGPPNPGARVGASPFLLRGWFRVGTAGGAPRPGVGFGTPKSPAGPRCLGLRCP